MSYTSKEFVSVAFCPKDDKRHMVTLCGEPDWCVLLWQHDMFKILARIDLGFNDPTIGHTFQMSYRNVSTELVVTLTGQGVYRWIEVNNSMSGFKIMQD